MKEDWLKDIHDKMADYEADTPHGLWNDICQARQSMPTAAADDSHRPTLRLWMRRVAAAAAMVALVVSIGYYAMNSEEGQHAQLAASQQLVVDTDEATTSNAEPYTTEETIGGNTRLKPKQTLMLAMAKPVGTAAESAASNHNSLEATLSGDVASDNIPSDNKSANEQDTKSANKQDTKSANKQILHQPSNVTPNYTYDQDFSPVKTGRSKEMRGRLAMGVFMASGSNAAINSSTMSEPIVAAGVDGSEWEDSPMLGILLYNQGKEMKTNIKHRQPIRMGLKVDYQINNRLSIESGLTYANLTSDISEGTDSHYFTGEQKLHYVGIPVGIRYKAISWRGLDVYASAGIMAEKCVDAKQDKQYVISGNVKKQESVSLDDKPMQWSLNASAGVQYNISSAVGIYAEPGIGYYFDDGTSIDNIYKEKSFNLNLNFGLRFTLGNK